MKKLLISSSIAAALTLAGCGGGETIVDLQADTPDVAPKSRILFDPGAGILNTPNDLLMLPGDDGFFDYTLNIPVDDVTNFSDPTNALNVLDGWSTSTPFVIDIVTPPNVSIDASTLSAGIRIFEATLGLDQSNATCAAIAVPSAGCVLGDELQFGVDFVMQMADDNTVTVIPLRPFKPAQGHILVMTKDLKDSTGAAVEGSTTYELVRQDPSTAPLASQSQLDLQNLINSHIVMLAQGGITRDQITYTSTFMTQSTMTVPNTIKQVMVGEFAQRTAAGDPTAGQALPAIVASDAPVANAMEALQLVSSDAVSGAVALGVSGLPVAAQALVPVIEAADFSGFTTCGGLLTAAGGGFGHPVAEVNDFAQGVAQGVLASAGPFCAAKLASATISLPHYLAVPRADNPLAPVNEFMTAACDSGIVLANVPAETLAAAQPGPNHALCQSVGLADLSVNGQNLDKDRNLTRFNPVPQAKGLNDGNMTLDVQITVPDPIAAGALGITIAEPAEGWPVAILYHGITRQKEDMLALSGALSLAGIATVAIDQPLHGSRGYDLDPTSPGDEINATTVSATVFMNLETLPTARSNLWQSISDLLGVRLGLNAVVDGTSGAMVNLNPRNVSVMGVSLGAIGGGSFAAVANTSMPEPLNAFDAMYEIKAASLESPGAGVTQFLLDSVAFGDLIRGLLLGQADENFQNYVVQENGLDSFAQATNDMNAAAAPLYLAALSAEQRAAAEGVFAQFAFAAQTVLDAADPINYVATLGMNTPMHVMTVVGDGSDANLPDQVIPVSTALPLSGQDAYVEQAGSTQVSASVVGTTPLNAFVQFNSGAHGSSLSPDASAAVTTEMQRQIASFIASGGTVLPITDATVVVD